MAALHPPSDIPPPRRVAPPPPPHRRIRADSQRRERWRDLGAAACVLGAVLLVMRLLPSG
jgi:ferric-dicitrate binding protein FerR (iron transport regulator)